MPSTFKEIAIDIAKKQPKQVDYVTEDAPILSNMPFEQASHGFYNVYDEVTSIEGPSFVDLDSELPEMDVDSKLNQFDLSIFGGRVQVGQDKARKFGGFGKYLARKEGSLMRQAGMSAEVAILYNMIRAYAIKKGGKLDAGGENNTNSCILAVRFVSGETTGLYSPLAFKSGVLLDFESIAGGKLVDIEVKRNGVVKKIPGFAGVYKSYFGFQIANARTVDGIFNIDRFAEVPIIPTKSQIDDLLDNVRATGSNTLLLMHPRTKTLLNTYKDTPLRMDVEDKRFDRRIDFWHDVPIVTSWNFEDGTETNVTW